MSGLLTLTLRDWADGTAELRAEVRTKQFSGVGAASFNRQDLRARAREFAKFPLDPSEIIAIAGGYWSKNDPPILLQEHLFIGVTPADMRGALTMRIRLGVPCDTPNRSEPRCSVSVEFMVQYPQLAKFAEDLLALVGTNVQAVTLEADGETC